MADGMIPDEELVRRAQEGEGTAFDVLVERHYRQIYALAFQILGDPDDAADVTQETFVKAFENLRRFRHRCKFATWLYRIALNSCRDFRRRRREIPFSQIIPPDAPDFDPISLSESDPEQVWNQREKAEAVQKTLQQLPLGMRQILVLCDMQGLSYAEVADILGMPEGTVKSRLHRARHAFKEAWERLHGEKIRPLSRQKEGDE